MSARPAGPFSSGCTNAPPAAVSEIASRPGAFSVNIHTPDFPGGAIRGQLHKEARPAPRVH